MVRLSTPRFGHPCRVNDVEQTVKNLQSLYPIIRRNMASRRFVLINVLLDHLKANSRHSGKAKRSRSGGRHIDYPPAHKGTTVVDPNHDGAAGLMICHRTFVPNGKERCAAVIS